MKSNTGQTIRRLKEENKQLRIGGVSQQRELLFAWEKYKKEFPYSDTPISELIEKYTSRN